MDHAPRLAPRALLLIVVALAVVIGAAVPASAQLTGVDVASYQHQGGAPINWQSVRAAGHSFAFIKATEDANYTNPYFASDWAAAGNAGLYRGAYHFARPALPMSTAIDQARWFVSRTGVMSGALDLPAVLDLESTGGLGQADLAQWTRTWLAEVQRLTGKPPIVYTGYYFWRDSVGNPTDIGARYRLWLPSYPADPNSTTFRPLVPAGWPTWTFWQYTSAGSVPGIAGSVDLNRFCCDVGGLAALGGTGVNAGNPFGNVDGVSRTPGAVGVSGWVIDPDTTGSVGVHLYVDGMWAGATTANTRRPDVGASYPGWSADHGFQISVPVGPGDHRVCAYAINVGSGSTNPELGCRTVVGTPFGNLDSVQASGPGQLTASGWALDPDTTGPIAVDVYVDGRMMARGGTGMPRADVAQAFSGVGNGGYSLTIAGLPAGPHEVCTYAINTGSGGTNPRLGCLTTSASGGDPFGNVDGDTPLFAGSRVTGWAIDTDTTSPVQVHLYVDGAWGGATTADVARPDVGSVYPLFGGRRGWSVDLPLARGSHEVCAYAINVGAGTTNSRLGCRTVTTSSAPVGSFDDAARWMDLVLVSGWAIDPDTAAPITMRILVDGVVTATIAADGARPDVGAAYPTHGPDHGFSSIIGVPPGRHTVCMVAVNAGAGSTDSSLGCRAV